MLTIRLITTLGLCAFAVSAALAQDMTEPTPRQAFVSFVTQTPLSNIKLKPITETAQVESKAVVEDIKSANVAQTRDLDLPSSSPSPNTPKIIPFYLSATDYLDRRGRDIQEQVRLDYKLTPINPTTGLSAKTKSLSLLIGSDFVAVTRDDKTRIFDFKLNRLLSVRPHEDEVVFDNISLFPVALKNIQTVRSATQNGRRTQIKIGPDDTLAAYWMESSLGWSARPKVDGLSTTRDDQTFRADYHDKAAAKLVLTGPNLPSVSHAQAFFAFLHHDVAIHPVALLDIGKIDRLPEQMDITTYSPNYKGGLKTIWTLESHDALKAGFPLSDSVKNSITTPSASPIGYMIHAAQSGHDLNPKITDNDLRQTIFDKTMAEDYVGAWIAAKTLAERLGSCENDPALLCEDIKEIESRSDDQSSLTSLMWALRAHTLKSDKIKALKILQPLLKDDQAPAFIVKQAGQLRSKLKTSELQDESLVALRADRLLEEALAKNPYDPEIYLTLSQIYAAQKRYAESWDILDALRQLPNVPEALTAPVTRVEASLMEQAPAFFLPK